jgi:hypothetical protein
MVKSIKLALAVCTLSALAAVRANGQTNTPPQLTPQPDRTIPELTTLVVTNTATDQDVPAQRLSYELLDRPAGASIDTNGVITWTPSEAQGPGTYIIRTVVADDGAPPMAAINSFTVVVTEVNSAPRLGFIADQTVAELRTLVVTNTATDDDLPPDTLSYALLNPPAGATINGSGVINFTPIRGQGPSTNTITTVVTDNGQPPLSATNSFTVVVTVPSSFKTNVVLNVNISLTAHTQITTRLNTNGAVVLSVHATKISTSDFIAAIGADIGHGTSIFSAKAKLLFVFGDVGGANPQNAFFVRVGTNDTDVSHYLQITSPSQSVVNSRTNDNKGTVREINYQILEFKLLNTSKGNFDVQGFATVPGTTLVNKGRVINPGAFPTAIMANVAGPGHIGGSVAVFQGTVTASGHTVEIRPVPGP